MGRQRAASAEVLCYSRILLFFTGILKQLEAKRWIKHCNWQRSTRVVRSEGLEQCLFFPFKGSANQPTNLLIFFLPFKPQILAYRGRCLYQIWDSSGRWWWCPSGLANVFPIAKGTWKPKPPLRGARVRPRLAVSRHFAAASWVGSVPSGLACYQGAAQCPNSAHTHLQIGCRWFVN